MELSEAYEILKTCVGVDSYTCYDDGEEYATVDGEVNLKKFADLLLAERLSATERAAKILDEHASEQGEVPDDQWHAKTSRFLRRLAASIRSQP